jgi:hypothetical protein
MFRLASRMSILPVLLLLAAAALAPSRAEAQPFGWFLVLNGPAGSNRYIEVPSSHALDLTGNFTIEFWAFTGGVNTGCQNFIGKGYSTAYWVGRCGNTLRSYRNGVVRDGGTLPANDYVHIAVTFDGARRKHYVDGELVGVFPEAGAQAANTKPFRIGGDFDYPNNSFVGEMFEVRVWNVARTQAQIRQSISQRITAPAAGLVGNWHLDRNGVDSAGGHNGTAVGGVDYAIVDGSTECTFFNDTVNYTCLVHRFEVVPSYVVYSAPAADGHVTETSRGQGHFVPDATNNSAIIWFFSPDNWEVLVKMPSGTCALSHTYWLFAAATTNVHYKLVVTDIGSGIGPEERGQQRIYFNYSGPPAPAIIDTTSFTACVP